MQEKAVIPVSQHYPNKFAEVLAQHKIADVIATSHFAGTQLYVGKADDTLETGLKLLARAKITAIPILEDNNKAMGFVDLADICKFIVVRAKEASQQAMESELPKMLAAVKLRDLVDFSKKDPLIVTSTQSSAVDAASMLAKGAHRLLVFNERQAFSVCSQSDIVRFLATFLDMKGREDPAVEQLAKRTVNETGAVSQLWDARRPSGVLSIQADATVFQALQKLATSGASGLAVVEPKSGKLLANFSASDLKAFAREDPKQLPYELFFEKVIDFLAKHSPASTKPITAVLRAEGPSLGSVIQLAAKSRVKRVWMVDESFKPVGVATLSNLLAAVISYDQTPSPRAHDASAAEKKVD